jgi:ADP-ribose pyrophosphatase YjhB (NUDIX family)
VTSTSDTDAPAFTKALVAAGAVFVDDHGRVLLVRPTYKSYWDIPGGYFEPGETPRAACIRELNEELGIRPRIGGLLSVDWAPHPEEGDKVLFIFDGRTLTDELLAEVRFATASSMSTRSQPLINCVSSQSSVSPSGLRRHWRLGELVQWPT